MAKHMKKFKFRGNDKYAWYQYRQFHQFLHPEPEVFPTLSPAAAAHFTKIVEGVKLWLNANDRKLTEPIWHTIKVVIASQALGLKVNDTYRLHARWGSEFTYDRIMKACNILGESPVWSYSRENGHVPGPVGKYIPVFFDTNDEHEERTWHVPLPEAIEDALDKWIEANEYDAEEVWIMVKGKPRGTEPKLAWSYPKLDRIIAELKRNQ